MGGGKGGGSSAPTPDPRIGEAAVMNAELGKQWLDFAKIQSADASQRQQLLDNLTQKIGEQQLATSDRLAQWAEQDRGLALEDRERALADREKFTQWGEEDRARSLEDRSWSLEQRGAAKERADADRAEVERQREANKPIEERMRADAMGWDSAENLETAAGKARADVLASAEGERGRQQRQMASMGIDPRSGRFKGIDTATGNRTALAAAGAQNQVRDNLRQQAVGMRGNVAQYGIGAQGAAGQQQGMNTNAAMSAAGFGAGQYNAGLGAAGLAASSGQAAGASQGAGVGTYGASTATGNSVLSGQAGANQAALAPNSIMAQGYGGAMQGNTSMMNGLNTQYGNELQAWSANRQAASQETAGLWSGLGQMAGTAAGIYFSSKDAKTDKRPIEGSALEAVKGMPVESWRYKEGVEDGGANEHIGPYAEDFQEATGKGDGKGIPAQDMMGLQLKAIQELGLEVEKLKGGKKTNRRPSDIKAKYEEKVA